MNKKIDIILLATSLVSFLLVAVSLTVMSFGSSATSKGISDLGMVCGICFWLFLITGGVLQVLLSRRIRNWKEKYQRAIPGMNEYPKIGLVSVFRNLPGAIGDLLFIVSVIAFAVSYFLTDGIGVICYISLSIIFFSFCSHCIFNGKNYYYIVNRQAIENKYKKMTGEQQ